MPWPSFLAPAHRGVNPVALRVAGRFGSLVDLEHAGRRTGVLRHTPVRAFRRSDSVVVGANFGAGSDWVKNVLAARGCSMTMTMTMAGRRLTLRDPHLVPFSDAAGMLPPWFRWGLGNVVRTDHCLVLSVALTFGIESVPRRHRLGGTMIHPSANGIGDARWR